MGKQKRLYVSIPVYDPNQKINIEHVYTAVSADAVNRYRKLQGDDISFEIGIDEHGWDVDSSDLLEDDDSSWKKGEGDVVEKIRTSLFMLNVEYDDITRHTDEAYDKTIQDMIHKLYAKGDIYKKRIDCRRCSSCDELWENNQTDGLVCPKCGRRLVRATEYAYYFRASAYMERMRNYLDTHLDFIQPEGRKTEILNDMATGNLDDFCISTDSVHGGIPVEFDRGHVVYLINDVFPYNSSISESVSESKIKSESESAPEFNSNLESVPKFESESRFLSEFELKTESISEFETGGSNNRLDTNDIVYIYLLSPDREQFEKNEYENNNIIYWPIIMMALGLPLPQRIYDYSWTEANEKNYFWTAAKEENDFWALSQKEEDVDPVQIILKYGTDALRYYLLKEMNHPSGFSFHEDQLVSMLHSDLISGLDRLLRTVSFLAKRYFDGKLPVWRGEAECEEDMELIQLTEQTVEQVNTYMERNNYAKALESIWYLISRTNVYLDDRKLWDQSKETCCEGERDRLAQVLYHSSECLRFIGVLLRPFLPQTGKRILDSLKVPDSQRTFDSLKTFGDECFVKEHEDCFSLYSEIISYPDIDTYPGADSYIEIDDINNIYNHLETKAQLDDGENAGAARRFLLCLNLNPNGAEEMMLN
ncbi:MAG: class I tRNA ligase family protein [Clostridiales bacterium]|nr:class I tRNA ligase family protein [Clostridiales bacterium]